MQRQKFIVTTVTLAFLLFVEGSARAQAPPPPPEPPDAPHGARDERQRARDLARASRDKEDHEYHLGSSYLDRREYDKAIDAFNRVFEQKGSRADGALYWRAYAQNKLGRRDDALASLAELQKSYPASHWLDDAKALEVEVRQKSGQPVSPENASDEELKLLAINSLMNSDPERSLPLLENLLKSSNSPKLKERALFVLAQSHSQQARDILSKAARGASNPDLQMKAVEYLGIFGGNENRQTLMDVYKSSSDVAVKRAILRSLMVSGSRDELLAAAKSESNPDLKIEAIRQLGNMGGTADLAQLYTSESSPQVKHVIIQALFVSGNADKLFELAKGEKDAGLRLEAIRQLGLMGRTKTAPFLLQMYAQDSDPNIKKTVLESLFIQGNASGLVELAKKESDPQMKKRIVERLSLMHSKEATDYLMELLK
jgi:tetratricopeptide (TPR) repeat protein